MVSNNVTEFPRCKKTAYVNHSTRAIRARLLTEVSRANICAYLETAFESFIDPRVDTVCISIRQYP
jgi:hypothetical protein